MFDGIEYRGYGQEMVEALAKYTNVPVWNGLTNEYHPTQMLADMLTIREHLGKLKGLKLVYFGDARYNIGNSSFALSWDSTLFSAVLKNMLQMRLLLKSAGNGRRKAAVQLL